MFVLSNFINALATITNMALEIYKWVLIARIITSWVNADKYNPIVSFLYKATEPILNKIRNKLPVSFGGIDASPIIAFFLIFFLQEFLIKSLFAFAVNI